MPNKQRGVEVRCHKYGPAATLADVRRLLADAEALGFSDAAVAVAVPMGETDQSVRVLVLRDLVEEEAE